MWLINSSIGRKVVMSVTGVCLILFLTFHCAMNVVALFSGAGYNMICELLGSNWYAVAATCGLAALALIHIFYAFWLTMQNRKARGPERYHETARRSEVSWASQNMLVLGIIILLGLLLHLYNFWYNMMFAELVGMEGLAHGPADGFGWIKGCYLVPSLSRFLERYADTRCERKDMVQALEGYRYYLHHRSYCVVHHRCSCLCFQVCSEPLLWCL